MVRWSKWMGSVTVGLALAWQFTPALAQELSPSDEPTPAQLPEDDDAQAPADDSTDMSSDEQGDQRDDSSDAPAEMPIKPRAVDTSADPIDSDANDVAEEDGAPEREVIKERFPDGTLRIEREVSQDDQGNYFNDGSWKAWDQRGNLIAEGEFARGRRVGPWVRWYRNVIEADMLQTPPYRFFPGPFISQANFEDGQLEGAWTIYDSRKNKVSEWHFRAGLRHGPSTWWSPNGHKLREVQYRNGQPHGQWLEWGPEGSLLVKESYDDGRRLAPKVTARFPDGSKKSEGMFLFAAQVVQTPDDWWNCKTLVSMQTGKDERHGAWSAWYANGQPLTEGAYEHDLQTGQFTWWHSNGQKALEGRYEDGKQNGTWTWWYPTGQKSIHGNYDHGSPMGRWTWWKEDGKVSQAADLTPGDEVVIDQPGALDGDSPTEARQTQPRKLKR